MQRDATVLEVRIPARWAIDEVIVETTGLVQPASDRYPKVASPSHTILVLAALAGWAFSHKISADHSGGSSKPRPLLPAHSLV